MANYFKSKGLANKRKKNIIFSASLSLLLLGIIFIDQCYFPTFMSSYWQIKTSYENDEKFAIKVENVLPQGAMIFQLPFMRFPENGQINKMGDYDQIRPYLHTTGLRWSYGDSIGRKASNWNQSTAKLPTEQMMQHLAAAGFSGIYIDRFGYQDAENEVEGIIRSYAKTEPIVSDDKRFVFYDIRAYANDYRSKFSNDEWQVLSALALKVE